MRLLPGDRMARFWRSRVRMVKALRGCSCFRLRMTTTTTMSRVDPGFRLRPVISLSTLHEAQPSNIDAMKGEFCG